MTTLPAAEADTELATVLAQHGADRHALLQMLIALQDRLGWLPRRTLAALADALALPLAEVEGVAGFYRFLHLQPVGRWRLLFSDNVTDRQAGSRELMALLCERLRVKPGARRDDGRVSVDATSCIGLADQGPSLLVNHRQVVTRLGAGRIERIAELVEADTPLHQWPAEWSRVDDVVQRADVLLGPAPAPGEALRAALARGAEATLAELQASRLRGRGGAGYPTAQKWAACRATAAAGRIVVCNADEGEPGTFKDRTLLRHHAHALFDGMAIAAFVLGAQRGFVYLRGEYRWLLDDLQAVLAERRRLGLLGSAILGQAGFDFDIAIHLGAGAYVCADSSQQT